MTVARLAVSLDPKLAKAIRKDVGKGSTSAWLADAARTKLQSRGLLGVVREWEAAHGALTHEEIRAAERRQRRARRR